MNEIESQGVQMTRSTITSLGVAGAALVLSAACLQTTANGDGTNSGEIELRKAWVGKVEGCPGCVVLEFRDQGSRVAYFAHAEPDCRLGPAHIDEAFAETEERRIALRLSDPGTDYASKCLSDDELDAQVVLVTVNGFVVGRSMFHEGFEVLTVVGSDGFALLLDLFPDE